MTDERRPLCLVPARGGSKRFKRKNIAPLAGKPLLAWTIEAAAASELFDAVWVSSEDAEILELAQRCGGTPLPRDPQLAQDAANVNQVCAGAVRQLQSQGHPATDLYVMLPTSPFRQVQTIRSAWQTFCESGADALFSVVPTEHPPQWALVGDGGRLRPFDPEAFEKNRDQLVPTVRHDGGHIIARIEAFLRGGTLLCPQTVAFPVSLEEAVDVNEPLHLHWAEFLLERGLLTGDGR